MKNKWIWNVLLVLTLFPGCYTLQKDVDNLFFDIRDNLRATGSWLDNYSWYEGVDHRADFEAGYKAGYLAVARGGAGCLPALPPRKYWGVWYQTGRGKQKVVSWYNGYSQGAVVAEQEGANQYREIPIRPTPVNHLPPEPESEQGQQGIFENHEDGHGTQTEAPYPAPAADLESSQQPVQDAELESSQQTDSNGTKNQDRLRVAQDSSPIDTTSVTPVGIGQENEN